MTPPEAGGVWKTVTDHDSVARICHETQRLRLQAADLEGRAMSVTRELREAMERHRELVERLRETQTSMRKLMGATPDENPQRNQRGSAR